MPGGFPPSEVLPAPTGQHRRTGSQEMVIDSWAVAVS